jgi:hypothetical protein
VSSATYRVAKLTSEFDLDAFDCGEPAYNEWLRQHALAAVSAGSAAVYVLLVERTGDERVMGYYAICPTLVVRDEVPKQLQRGLLRAAPGWLLAKLAVDVSLRRDKEARWGSQLLRDALERIVASADAGGGQIIVVDADNEGLLGWYGRHGFRPTGAENLRLFMKVATARQHLRG